jgi:hypothetical protein
MRAILIPVDCKFERVDLPDDMDARNEAIKYLIGSPREFWHTLEFQQAKVLTFHGDDGDQNDLATKLQDKSATWHGIQVFGPVILLSQNLEGWETSIDSRMMRTLETLSSPLLGL